MTKYSLFTGATNKAQIRQQLTQLLNDANRATDAINLCIDEDIDVVSLSFKNQERLPQFRRTNIPPPKTSLQYLRDDDQSNTSSSDEIYEQNLHIASSSLIEFFETYIYQLHSIQITSQSLEEQIHSQMAIQQLQLAKFRNVILLFSCTMETMVTSIAISNTLCVMFGSNVINFFTQEYNYAKLSNTKSYWGIFGFIAFFVVIYSIMCVYTMIKQAFKQKHEKWE